MSKIVVTGSKGQLGKAIRDIRNQYEDWDFTYFTRDILDFDTDENLSRLRETSFDYLINCAAYTAVDKAESETEKAFHLNSTVPEKIAEICKEKNAGLIHISTDYVYNGRGDKPYTENDLTDPQSVYGKSKLDGEQKVLKAYPKSIIIRTSWLYNSFGHNFLKTMLRLGAERESVKVVSDQIGTPTYAPDLAIAIMEVVKNYIPGIYNYSNEGEASWYDFAKQIMELAKLDCEIIPVDSSEYLTVANRPLYSVLDKSKIRKTFNIAIPDWSDSLKMCFQ